ncbi:MAG: Hsp20 family protein [Enterobacterales bacterium]|nr:Hsp20 family protein [Enterobacterales bacterium]
MNITPWQSFRHFDDLFNGLNRAVINRPNEEDTLSADWVPAVDVTENSDAFLIKAELPEVNKEDVKVSLEKYILTISGERTIEKRSKTASN